MTSMLYHDLLQSHKRELQGYTLSTTVFNTENCKAIFFPTTVLTKRTARLYSDLLQSWREKLRGYILSIKKAPLMILISQYGGCVNSVSAVPSSSPSGLCRHGPGHRLTFTGPI